MKLPWEKDPNDREANYKRPVPRSEAIRTGAKFILAAAAGGWLWLATADGCNVDDLHDVCTPADRSSGTKLVLAVGTVLLLAGVIDLAYLRSHEIELVFARHKKQQVIARWVMVAAGLLAVVASASRLS